MGDVEDAVDGVVHDLSSLRGDTRFAAATKKLAGTLLKQFLHSDHTLDSISA